MKVSDVASKLGVTTQTINIWVKAFGDFFSEQVKLARNKSFSADDLDVLATIAKLSKVEGLGYDAIRERLTEGLRESFDSISIGVDSPMIAQSTAKVMIDTSRLQAELEFKNAELQRLASEIQRKDEAIDERDKRIADLQKEIGNLKYELGLTKGELDTRKRKRWPF